MTEQILPTYYKQQCAKQSASRKKKKSFGLDSQNYYSSTALKVIQEGTSHKHNTPSPDTNVIQSVYDGTGLKTSVIFIKP